MMGIAAHGDERGTVAELDGARAGVFGGLGVARGISVFFRPT